MRAANANLDPESYRHEIPDAPNGLLRISQVDHGFQIRDMPDLHVPCACGRPLCGLDTELFTESRGFAIHFSGVCLKCGVQYGIYVSMPHMATAEEERVRKETRLKEDIARVIEQALALRQGSPEDEATEAVKAVVEAA